MPEETIQYTAQDRADWQKFEKVRQGGRYNMFDPNTRKSTGLSGDRYSFIMRNYSQIKALINTVPA